MPTCWLLDLTYTQQQISADVIPAAIGQIASFCRANLDPTPEIRLFKYPEEVLAALEQESPQVVGFSNYCWNFQLSYRFARHFREVSPETVILFGGPNYPTEPAEQELFLREHPVIDLYVVKEGEVTFLEVVRRLAELGLDRAGLKQQAIPGTHVLDPQGRLAAFSPGPRLTDLTLIPSPYTTGMLDPFFDGKLMPILQTNRGCPFSCTFCVEGLSYYNKVYTHSGEKIASEIDYIGRKMQQTRDQGGRNDLFIADSNFGMYKDDPETCRQLARSQERYQWPEYIHVATGKNRKERVLESSRLVNGALRLSGSVQSLDAEVQANIKRSNIDAQKLMELALEASDIGANSYSEIILSLPGDSVAKHYETIRVVIDAGFNNVYLFQLMMLPGTDMASRQTRERFNMQTRYRVLPRCFGTYDHAAGHLTCGEVEEICVAQDSLSFEEYLRCRKFHLIVTCFYNDGVFGGVLNLLASIGISRFRWLELLDQATYPDAMQRLMDEFLAETRAELWDDREELLAFLAEPENVRRYITGELGANLLFKYKGLLITQHLETLAEVARNAARQVLQEQGQLSPELQELLDDILAYELCRKVDLFSDDQLPRYAELRYDVEPYINGTSELPPAIPFSSARRVMFTHDPEQREIIERNVRLYGADTLGITRILSKVFLKKLFRYASSA